MEYLLCVPGRCRFPPRRHLPFSHVASLFDFFNRHHHPSCVPFEPTILCSIAHYYTICPSSKMQ